MEKRIEFIPSGVCSRKMEFVVDGEIIKELVVTGGCNGNLGGISKLLQGMNVHEVISRLKGTTCGAKPTSCPDQIATALAKEFENK